VSVQAQPEKIYIEERSCGIKAFGALEQGNRVKEFVTNV
jgi:hypothetical protein